MTQEYAYGMWVIAAFNVGLFQFFFMSFLPPKGFAEWGNLGVVAAFLVALFSEMYGFPLTIYLPTGWLGDAYPVLQPFSHKFGHLWVVVFGGSDLAWALMMGASQALMLAAYILLSRGWRQVHGGHSRHGSHGTGHDAKHTDPVCGMEVAADQGYGKMHEGKLYRFCSRNCLDKFEAEPERYLNPPAEGEGGAQ